MSKYTTEVRFICESYAGMTESKGYNDVIGIIRASWEKVFDFDFPIYDPNYKFTLCSKIIMHYYTREIGLETVGLWKLKLQTKMREIMPYYNELYKTLDLKYNPIYDVDYYREHEGKDSGSNKGDNSMLTHGVGYDLFSDTPQGALTGVDSETYLTNAGKRINDSNSTGESSNEYSNTDEYLDHVYGKFPGHSYAKMIREYRDNIINVDRQIIDELSDLFMKLW